MSQTVSERFQAAPRPSLNAFEPLPDVFFSRSLSLTVSGRFGASPKPFLSDAAIFQVSGANVRRVWIAPPRAFGT